MIGIGAILMARHKVAKALRSVEAEKEHAPVCPEPMEFNDEAMWNEEFFSNLYQYMDDIDIKDLRAPRPATAIERKQRTTRFGRMGA